MLLDKNKCNKKDLSIIPINILVPTHNRLNLLKKTVDSVLACSPIQNPVRLIIIENGGKFGADQLTEERSSWITPEYHYVERGNKSAALNAVIEGLNESLILFLDDDVRVGPSFLKRYSEVAASVGLGSFFGGEVLAEYENDPPDWLVRFLPRSATGWHPEKHSPQGTMHFLGANWAVFSKDLMRAGGFDSNLGPGGTIGGTGQEINMQERLEHVGIKPHFIPSAEVWHYVPHDRSSPNWTLQRAFKMAVTSGFRLTEDKLNPQILGLPLWLVRLMFANGFKFLSATVRRDPVQRFEAKFKFMENLGSIRGIRMKRQSLVSKHK